MNPPQTPCPLKLSPQLVSLVGSPPPGDWLYENKLDGYRVLARIANGEASVFTRNGHNWSKRMPGLVGELKKLPLESAWLDGEVVALDDDGLPAFSLVQAAFAAGKTKHLIYFTFDLMYLNGQDLRGIPIEERRRQLLELIEGVALPHVRFSASFDADPRDLLASVCAMGMEGIVGKRAGSTYTSRRSGDWVKLKCGNRQQFIIVGFTRSRGGIDSLLLGLHDDGGRLLYAGRVQSGMTQRMQEDLLAHLTCLTLADIGCPLSRPGRRDLQVTWVEPSLVCEIRFAEFTPSGRVRHAVFVGLCPDSPAASVSNESTSPADH